jgi:hypothetical protein
MTSASTAWCEVVLEVGTARLSIRNSVHDLPVVHTVELIPRSQ